MEAHIRKLTVEKMMESDVVSLIHCRLYRTPFSWPQPFVCQVQRLSTSQSREGPGWGQAQAVFFFFCISIMTFRMDCASSINTMWIHYMKGVVQYIVGIIVQIIVTFKLWEDAVQNIGMLCYSVTLLCEFCWNPMVILCH